MPARYKRWEWYHTDNPHVYNHFRRLTIEATNHGARRLSAWWVVNVMRWEMAFRTTDRSSDFKISNDYIAYYARQFMYDHPQHHGLFQTKELMDEPYWWLERLEEINRDAVSD